MEGDISKISKIIWEAPFAILSEDKSDARVYTYANKVCKSWPSIALLGFFDRIFWVCTGCFISLGDKLGQPHWHPFKARSE